MDINSIRKAELHCHVDGLLNPVVYNMLSPESEIRRLIPDLGQYCPVKDFTDWTERYNPAVLTILKNRGDLSLEILVQYLRTLRSQNVIYAEIMIVGFNMQYADTDRQVELYNEVRKAADAVSGEGLQVEFITRENHRLWRWSTSLLAGGIRALPESSRRNKRPPPAVREYKSMRLSEAGSSITIFIDIRELLEALFKGS